MPVTLDATVGGSTANSYLTLERATALLEARLDTAAWETASADDQTRALLQATRSLDLRVDWLGTRATTTQRLDWPRRGVVDIDTHQPMAETIIPPFLEGATAEYALALLGQVASAGATGVSGLKRLVDGSVTLEWHAPDAAMPAPGALPDAVAWYLEGYGESSAGSHLVWLKRS